MYLYRNDKEWLTSNVPTLKKKATPIQKVDWHNSD
ncbi:hypothetical protein DN401_04030 [Bacillus sp. BF2-3]|nr:hypothetical protein DN401_04030 [Bacillus sp. BF2-3]